MDDSIQRASQDKLVVSSIFGQKKAAFLGLIWSRLDLTLDPVPKFKSSIYTNRMRGKICQLNNTVKYIHCQHEHARKYNFIIFCLHPHMFINIHSWGKDLKFVFDAALLNVLYL